MGLDNSGKTTIVKRLTGEPVDSVVPTVGFSVATLRKKTCRVSMYDLGGGPQIRDIWPRYYADVSKMGGIIRGCLLLRNLMENFKSMKESFRHPFFPFFIKV